jgi:hypothetical protein
MAAVAAKGGRTALGRHSRIRILRDGGNNGHLVTIQARSHRLQEPDVLVDVDVHEAPEHSLVVDEPLLMPELARRVFDGSVTVPALAWISALPP